MTIYEIEEANSDDSEVASVPPSNLPFTLAPGDINGDGLVNEVDETLRQMGITAEDYRNSQAEASEAVAEDPLPGLSTLSLIAVLGGGGPPSEASRERLMGGDGGTDESCVWPPMRTSDRCP